MRTRSILLVGAAAALIAALPASADEIVVYTRGGVIRYDPDVGRDLLEAVLVTYDTDARGPVKKESLETFYHLSDDQEVITPAQITAAVQRVFVIEKKGGRFFYRGLRKAGEPAPPAPAPTPPPTEPPTTEPPATEPPSTEPPATEPPSTEPPATEPPSTEPPSTEPPSTEPPATEPPSTEPPAPLPPGAEGPPAEPAVEELAPPTKEEVVDSVREKVQRVTREILAVDPRSKEGPRLRASIINREFTTSLKGFDQDQLQEVAFIVLDEGLSPNRTYYVLRSFGWAFHQAEEYDKAVFFYDRCLEIIPDNYSAYMQKGYALELGHRVDEALRAYTKAMSLKPQKVVIRVFGILKNTEETGYLLHEDIVLLRRELRGVIQALRDKDVRLAQELADGMLGLIVEAKARAESAPPPPPPDEGAALPPPPPPPAEDDPSASPPPDDDPPPPPDDDPLPGACAPGGADAPRLALAAAAAR